MGFTRSSSSTFDFTATVFIAVAMATSITLPGAFVQAGYGRPAAGGYAQQASQQAVQELNSNQGVATWSAQSAVAAAVGQDYNNQLGTTAQFVSQFTSPVTKQQTAEAFKAVQNQQRGAQVSAALAANAPAIAQAAKGAAKSNFAQAYQAAQGNTLHGLAADAAAQQMAHLAGSSLAAQQLQAAHYAQQASADKTQQTAVNAAAQQAVNAVNNLNRQAGYSFTDGNFGGSGSGGGRGYGGR